MKYFEIIQKNNASKWMPVLICSMLGILLTFMLLILFKENVFSIDHYAPNCPSAAISAYVPLMPSPGYYLCDQNYNGCTYNTASLPSNVSVVKINEGAECGPPSVTVISPTQIDIRFPNYNCSDCLCRQVYPLTFVAGEGWKITKCYTRLCVTTVLQREYEGTFWTGPLEDTTELEGDGRPDYDIKIVATEVPAPACCGNEIHEPSSGEECDNVTGFVYTDNVSDCPYGANNCCYTHANSTVLLRCTTYNGGYCGDGDVQEPDENCDDNPNFNWDDSLYVDVFDPSKPYCHTDTYITPANRCRTYEPGYCGDGDVDNIENGADGDYEDCDLGAALNGTGRGCTVNCTDENTAWFRTWNGDVYSSGGATQSIPSGVPWNSVFSTYMCYNKTGQFTVGLGCFDQGVFESQPTSIFATNLNEDASVEMKTNAEFEKIKNKIEATTDWSGFEYNLNKPNNQDFAQIVQRNYIYYFNSDFTVPVEINNNIRYSESCLNERSCSLLIVVDGDVTITELVEHIDAFIIASGRIIVESSYMDD